MSVHTLSGDNMSVKFTARIPKELKERMDMFSYVNWSEVVRKAIEEKFVRKRLSWL